MHYNVSFDVAAIILNAMLILTVYLRRTYPSQSCMMYKRMLWLNLCSSCADLVSAYTIMHTEAVPLSINYLVNFLYIAAHNLTAIVFLLYVIVLIRGDLGTKFERVFWVGVGAFETALIVTTPLTKGLFYFDENGAYCHGPLMYVLYASAAAVLLYAFILFIRHRHILNRFQMTTNIVFLSLVCCSVVYQFFYPEVLIESFTIAVSMMMMNVALDNPATYFYGNSTCYNAAAFEAAVGERLDDGSAFSVLAVTLDDLSVFRKKFGEAAFSNLTDAMIRISHRLFGQSRVYLLSDGSFAVCPIDAEKTDAAIDCFSDAVGRITVGEKTYTFAPHFCVLTCPGFAKTVGDVLDAVSYMLTDGYKKSGQRVIRDDAAPLEEKHREERIVHLLHNALQDGGFEVRYQPIWDRETGRYATSEALIRFSGESPDQMTPDIFIPIAEKNGMILEIGELVFEKVCLFFKNNREALETLDYIEVNLSKLQLLRPETAGRLTAICDAYGVPHEKINFEITETVDATEAERKTINECIGRLCKAGFTFSLDDYGSGCATASYLAEMPFSLVKLDRDLLWNAMKREDYRLVFRSAVNLITELHCECVVEGVENKDMEAFLSQLGCTYYQGYLYSRPLPEDAYLAFLAEHNGKNA